ncbi:thiamine phosphate synthase [Paenibacillus sp. MBLB4367]|uniref:thiamine phosphate synthase n=1 Tax=Paenibacillus sp. MBLB4367 TaxID=3384767 RepID=UPI00390812F8
MSERQAVRGSLALYLVMGLEGYEGRDAIAIAREALDGGVTMLQLREKKAPLKQVLELGGIIRDLCRDKGVPFIVNDRVDVALLLDADGVHVGQDDIPYALARSLLGPDKIIGVSTGLWEEALEAHKDGADYVGIGAVYATGTKSDAGEPIGTALIAKTARELGIPIVGIGGIDASNAAAVVEAGADGVAVVSAITRQQSPKEAARKLLQAIGK